MSSWQKKDGRKSQRAKNPRNAKSRREPKEKKIWKDPKSHKAPKNRTVGFDIKVAPSNGVEHTDEVVVDDCPPMDIRSFFGPTPQESSQRRDNVGNCGASEKLNEVAND